MLRLADEAAVAKCPPPHAAKPGITPLEHYMPGRSAGRIRSPSPPAPRFCARRPRTRAPAKGKTLKVCQRQLLRPDKLTVHVGATVDWHWPDGPHRRPRRQAQDGRPRASRSSTSDPASGGYFKRKLTKAGTYKIICTFHEEMKMTITVTG